MKEYVKIVYRLNHGNIRGYNPDKFSKPRYRLMKKSELYNFTIQLHINGHKIISTTSLTEEEYLEAKLALQTKKAQHKAAEAQALA